MEKTYSFIMLAVTLAVGSLLLPDHAFRKPERPVSIEEARNVPEVRDSASAFLSASAELSHGWFNAAGQTPMTLRLRIRAPRNTDRVRPPTDVVVVLDRSGSMAGDDRIGFARKALVEAGRGIREGDRLAVVSFSNLSSVERPLGPIDARENDLPAIAAHIRPEGGTNLDGGLCDALSLLRESPRDRRKQILVLSDGQANIGRQGEALAAFGAALGQEGIMVTAMGVGHDYDVRTFIGLSEGSGGGYAYVTRADRIPDAIRGELSRAGTRIIDNMRIRLDLAAGVTVIRAVKHTMRPAGRSVEILAPTLSEGEEKTILVDIVVEGAGRTGVLDEKLVTASLEYDRPHRDEHPERITLGVGARGTDNPDLVARSMNLDVVAERETLGADLAWADSARHVASGNFDLATAQLREEARMLRQKNDTLKSPSVAQRISDLLSAAMRIESRNFHGGSSASEATMGQNQAALSAGVY